MSENIAVSMGKELYRFLEEYKPTRYDALNQTAIIGDIQDLLNDECWEEGKK